MRPASYTDEQRDEIIFDALNSGLKYHKVAKKHCVSTSIVKRIMSEHRAIEREVQKALKEIEPTDEADAYGDQRYQDYTKADVLMARNAYIRAGQSFAGQKAKKPIERHTYGVASYG